MMRCSGCTAVCLSGALLVASGCVTFRGPERLRGNVVAEAKVELTKQAGLSANTFGLLWAAAFAEVPEVVWHISTFDVGIYDITHLPYGDRPPLDMRHFNLPEWTPAVYMHENGEDVRILVQQNSKRIRTLAAFFLDENELTIVRVSGNINKLLEQTTRDELLNDVERMQHLLERIARVRAVLKGADHAQRTNERRIRSVLHQSGWGARTVPEAEHPPDETPASAAGETGPD